MIRNAMIQDQGFIFQAIQQEAQEGHFNSDLLVPITHLGTLNQIQQTILHNKFPYVNGSKFGQIFIEEDNNNLRGFLWVIQENSTSSPIELYLGAVVKNARCIGVGTSLFSYPLTFYPQGSKFEARCYPSSVSAMSILKKLGFSGPQSTINTALLFTKR